MLIGQLRAQKFHLLIAWHGDKSYPQSGLVALKDDDDPVSHSTEHIHAQTEHPGIPGVFVAGWHVLIGSRNTAVEVSLLIRPKTHKLHPYGVSIFVPPNRLVSSSRVNLNNGSLTYAFVCYISPALYLSQALLDYLHLQFLHGETSNVAT